MSAPLRVVHLDLSQPLKEIPENERGMFCVLWWRDLPLGQIEIQREQLPMYLPELANRIAQAITPAIGNRLFKTGFLAQLPTNWRSQFATGEPAELTEILKTENPLCRLGENFETPGRSVSVVVCTRDRGESLRRCLRSLMKLSPAPNEIVVVDNAPQTDETHDVAGEFPNVRYLREPRAGLDIARNAGVKNSRSDIVAFADDDVEVHPAWIAKLRAVFADDDIMAVTGLVLPAEIETEAQYLFENYWGFNRGYRAKIFDRAWFERELPRGVPADQIGAGANMAFRRKIFEHIGGFDERLDVGAAGCSGDSEFWYRILAHGWKCRYEPSAVVFHHHRRAMENLDRQIFFYMRGHVTALLVQFEKFRHFGNLRRLLLTLPRYYIESLTGSLLKPEKRRTLWAQIAGHFSGIRFYFENR